jgi:hypothetical protein
LYNLIIITVVAVVGNDTYCFQALRRHRRDETITAGFFHEIIHRLCIIYIINYNSN